MTRRTNARVAGFAFLFYIVAGIGSMILSRRASGGEGIGAKLSSMAQHATEVHLAVVLTMLCAFSALVLAVTLYALTRDEDPDLAMLGMACRVGEGVVGGIAVHRSLGLLWLATAVGAHAPNPDGAHDIAAFLSYGQGWSATIAATFFAVGSTFFCWLLLRGRMIPAVMAWLGVIASVVLVVGLFLELGGVSVTQFVWLPMAVFEITFAVWLIFKGVGAPRRLLDSKSSMDGRAAVVG